MSYKNRQDYNRALVKVLGELVELMPEQRFNQLLHNIDITRPETGFNTQGSGTFNPPMLSVQEESKETFERAINSTTVGSYGIAKTLRILFGDKDEDTEG